MTALGRSLAAQEARVVSQQFPVEAPIGVPLLHELPEPLLKGLPGSTALLEAVEQLLRGREVGDMDVLDAGKLAREPGEVVPLGESRQLRAVVKPDVDQALHTRSFQEREEPLGRLPGESNRVDRVQLRSR